VIVCSDEYRSINTKVHCPTHSIEAEGTVNLSYLDNHNKESKVIIRTIDSSILCHQQQYTSSLYKGICYQSETTSEHEMPIHSSPVKHSHSHFPYQS